MTPRTGSATAIDCPSLANVHNAFVAASQTVTESLARCLGKIAQDHFDGLPKRWVFQLCELGQGARLPQDLRHAKAEIVADAIGDVGALSGTTKPVAVKRFVARVDVLDEGPLRL